MSHAVGRSLFESLVRHKYGVHEINYTSIEYIGRTGVPYIRMSRKACEKRRINKLKATHAHKAADRLVRVEFALFRQKREDESEDPHREKRGRVLSCARWVHSRKYSVVIIPDVRRMIHTTYEYMVVLSYIRKSRIETTAVTSTIESDKCTQRSWQGGRVSVLLQKREDESGSGSRHAIYDNKDDLLTQTEGLATEEIRTSRIAYITQLKLVLKASPER